MMSLDYVQQSYSTLNKTGFNVKDLQLANSRYESSK